MMYEKKNPIGITTYQETNNNEPLGETAIEKQISCYKTIDKDELKNMPIAEYITKLNNLFQRDNQYFSFLYQDLYSGYTVSYNESAPQFLHKVPLKLQQ